MMNGNNDDDNADDNDGDNDVDSADDNSVIIGKLNNICTRLRPFLGNRIIFVFVSYSSRVKKFKIATFTEAPFMVKLDF